MNPFTSKEQVLEYVKQAPNLAETQRLTERFGHLKTKRIPFYLDMTDLEQILIWKLRGQYGR